MKNERDSNGTDNQKSKIQNSNSVQLEYSELILQFIYTDSVILVICTGLSGEWYHLIDESIPEEIAKRSIAIHKLIFKSEKANASAKRKLSKVLQEFGTFLFEQVFKNEILDLLNIAIGQSIVKGKDILIRLMIDNSFLNIVPWELFFNDGRYLCHVYDIIRHPFSLQPVRQAYRDINTQKKLLFIGSNPPGAYVNIDEPKKAIEDILQDKDKNDFVGNGKSHSKLIFDSLIGEKCNHKEIANRLYDGIDILHFLGHGVCENVGKSIKYSFLIHSERNSGGTDKLPIEMLESFCRANPMRIAILNACNSDYVLINKNSKNSVKKMLEQDSYSEQYSMAHALLRTGVECVIGMSHKISKPGSIILNRRLYRAIIEREESVTKAIRQIRLELYAHAETDMGSIYPSDWLTPILYLRSQSYYIWNNE